MGDTLSTTPAPGSPVSAMAAAAATAAAAAKAAAEAAAMAAAARASSHGGDASQRTPMPLHTTPVSSGYATELPAQMWTCDSSGRQLCAKELEAHLRAAAPETYE